MIQFIEGFLGKMGSIFNRRGLHHLVNRLGSDSELNFSRGSNYGSLVGYVTGLTLADEFRGAVGMGKNLMW